MVFSMVMDVILPDSCRFDLYQCPMMNKSIYSGRGEGIIVIQDFTPIPEGSIGCNDNRAAFIPAGVHTGWR